MLLDEKSIIITGASSGIGAAAALLFAQNGAHVVLGARRENELDTIVGQITHSGGKAVALPGDVSDPKYAGELVKLAKSEFGDLAEAFNNAGNMGPGSMVAETSSEEWSDIIATNLTSAFHATQAQIAALARAWWRHIGVYRFVRPSYRNIAGNGGVCCREERSDWLGSVAGRGIGPRGSKL